MAGLPSPERVVKVLAQEHIPVPSEVPSKGEVKKLENSALDAAISLMLGKDRERSELAALSEMYNAALHLGAVYVFQFRRSINLEETPLEEVPSLFIRAAELVIETEGNRDRGRLFDAARGIVHDALISRASEGVDELEVLLAAAHIEFNPEEVAQGRTIKERSEIACASLPEDVKEGTIASVRKLKELQQRSLGIGGGNKIGQEREMIECLRTITQTLLDTTQDNDIKQSIHKTYLRLVREVLVIWTTYVQNPFDRLGVWGENNAARRDFQDDVTGPYHILGQQIN